LELEAVSVKRIIRELEFGVQKRIVEEDLEGIRS
jgi:hypothetical protein